MDHSSGRKKWTGGDKNLQMPLNAPAAKEEVPPQYEHYLHLLQERNRLVRRLRQKDKQDIELEKKEKGFTLYLNSSFSGGKDSKARADRRNRAQRAKTAGAGDHSKRAPLKGSIYNKQDVSKSAGGPARRRNWQIGSVEFTTADGHRQKVKPPEILTGKYAEDFEGNSSDDDNSEIVHSMSSLDIDGETNVSVNSSSSSLSTPRKPKTSYLKRVAAAKREEIEEENRVTIKMEDVKKLRESLQMNKTIRQSIAMDNDSDVEEEIAEQISQDESDGERVSPINEEIEELISSEDEDRGKDNIIKPLKLFKPGDTLVLEFQPLPTKSKAGTNLTAARKKTESEISSSFSSQKSSSSTSSSSKYEAPKNLALYSGANKASRPLSANRKSSDIKVDPKEEASAVMKALQEENKKVEMFSKGPGLRPLPQPKNSTNAVRSSATAKDKAQPPSPVKSSADPGSSRAGSLGSGNRSQIVGEGDANLNTVIERVLKMNPKQQKQLLQTLNHIDVDEKGIGVKKSISNLDSFTASWSSKGPETDRLEVTVEILSNWGHSSMVGLTELQFFDQSGCLVPVKPSDVTVHGARGSSNKVEVLFNGKSKTTKDRNMWSCKFEGRPVEFSILLINPNPGKSFQLGSVKVWNWNNKISNLDIGARRLRIFFGGELLYDGEVDKGCGNQIFDYSKHVMFSHSNKKAPKSLSKSGLSLNIDKASKSDSISPTLKGSNRNSPSSNQITSPVRALHSPLKVDSQTGLPSGSHHTFRSISRSSQSSASSSGSAKVRGQSEERQDEGQTRSETRTLMRPTVLNRRGSSGSGFSSPEVEMPGDDLSKMPEKKRAQTPMKTKRVAAKLNGRSSETENSSKSNADSFESKPPLPPPHKTDDKPTQSTASSRSVDRSTTKTKSNMSPKSSKSEPQISPRPLPNPSVDTNSKESNHSKMKEDKSKGLVDKIKDMGQGENKRRKDIPKWLKGDGSTEGMKSAEEDIEKQLEEEFEKFSNAGSESHNKPSKSVEEGEDILTPMKKIEKTRAKWRKNEDLEESWGSLSFFNKSHRGRVSIDMADDELDGYLNPTKKPETQAAEPPKLPIPDDSWSDEDSDFTIPELPYGRELVINIKSTWGDHHYVGLTGVQLFSSDGHQVPISKVWANPSDINILQEYSRDPRVVTNIIDNVNRTRDDVHMWLAPFTQGNNHLVYMTFAKPCKLALMRIWNYNKSRIHSFRGAKDVVISLDGAEIFKGEIARACGGIEGGTEAFGDTILFTTDETILDAVSKNDDAFEGEMLSDEEDVPFERPSTADAEDDTRPFTRAAGLAPSEKNKETAAPRPGTSFVTSVGDVLVYKANKLQLMFSATWGDYHYLGLTGLEVVGSEGEAIRLSMDIVTASPSDLRHLTGNEKDDRTLDKLLDGTNVTCHDSHMWLIPFCEGESHTVTVNFPEQTLVSGVRIWNYNKSPEDTYRGAKIMHVQVNDKTVSPPEGYLLRKGPGVCHFDFAQEISFSNASHSQGQSAVSVGSSGNGDQNYEGVVQMPRGFIFQFQLFSTWGDQYYIGLNGLEFYDAAFNKIELTQTNIAAYPDSVNVLDNVSNDARTPDKLIDGFNDTNDGRHMWLAPILPTIINRVYVIFDQPTSVSMIKLWNYSKTVNRGVKDFALLVDDLLVYNGTLQGVSGGAKGILPTCNASIPHHTVLFSDNKDIVRKEKNAIISNQTEDQDIQLLNDKQVVSKYAKSSSSKPVNQALRPKTSVTKVNRR